MKRSSLTTKGKKLNRFADSIPGHRPLWRILICSTIILLGALLISCGRREHRPDFFYTYVQSDPARLDPFSSTDVVSGRILAHLFNGLFRIDPDGNLVPDLAEGYSFNGVTLQVTLRKGVHFHSGDLLNADDVIFSFERIRRSENPTSPRKWVFANIQKILKTGKRSLAIRLKKPSSTFLSLLTMPTCFIISRESQQKHTAVIGTGPFILKEWKQDERLVLVRNPDYFGRKPQIRGIVYKIIPEDLTARFEFLNGRIDYFELPYLAKVTIQRPDLRTVEIPELSVHYIALNTEREPFTSRSFRRALNLAIDREAILKSLFSRGFRRAAGSVPPEVGTYRSTQTPYPYQPDRARKIFDELRLGDRPLSLFIKSDHQVSLIAQLIQHYLNSAGLRVEIREMEWSALKAATIRGRYDMCYFTWHADYPEPENFLFPLFFSHNRGAGGNRSFYRNREVDRMLITAQRILSREKRFDIYRRTERLITDDAPWIFLWYGSKRIILSGKVRAFQAYQLYHGMKGNEIVLSDQRAERKR